jgi:hypothetical protein
MISTKNHAMFSIIIRIYKVVKIIKHSPIYLKSKYYIAVKAIFCLCYCDNTTKHIITP